MSLDKAIENGKEKRKRYRGGKAVDKTCRNHGGCPWCLSNRTYQQRKKEEAAKRQLRDYFYGDNEYDEYEE